MKWFALFRSMGVPPMHPHGTWARRRCCVALFAVNFVLLASTASAQTSQPAGLDALKDDRLITELANLGLSDLLERAFQVNAVPEPRRVGIRALVALRALSDEQHPLSSVQRRELLSKIAAGIEQAITTLDDPQVMMQQANLLIRQGIRRDVNTLEYWGDNPRTQKELEPVVRAVIKLLDKCEAEARKQADEIGNQLSGPNDPRSKVWEETSALANNAAYTKHMIFYDLALCLPPAEERDQITQQAINYLKQFDTPDSTVQPLVRIQLGKLHMIRGEFDVAQTFLTSVADTKNIAPPPEIRQQYEARYFSAVCDVLASNELSARAKLEALLKWQDASLPKDKQTQDAADAAAMMLQYRLENLHAATEMAPATKQESANRARAILLDLVKRRPDLRGIVLDQLLQKLPSPNDVKKLDTLLLQAILQRADTERLRSESESIDASVLKLGIAAGEELLARRSREQLDLESIDAAALLIPLFQERLGDLLTAATGYLDYITGIGARGPNATLALDAAQSVIGRLRADSSRAGSADVQRLYERFLPLAINPPFSRRQLAFEYGRLLQQQEKYAQAVQALSLVPPTDPRVAVARFYQLVCTRQQLEEQKLDAPARQKLVQQFSLLTQQVNALAGDALTSAKTDVEKNRWRAILVRTALLDADLSRREQNDPRRTLALLENIEQHAKGLTGEETLLASALYTRVQAYMSLGLTDDATRALVQLLEHRNGGEGVSIVYELMQRLNHELDDARAAGEKARMSAIAANRAQLSGFLADWAQKSPDPNIHKYAYRYSVFDAATRHLAAELIEDPVNRAVTLRSVLDLYKKLESPESLVLYRATLDNPSVASTDSDPAVSLGIGLVSFDLADYPEAQKRLGRLLVDRKLGSPQRTIEENGIERVIDNDEYWEATLKLLRSNLALAGQHVDASSVDLRKQTQNHLKQLYVQWGNQTGGKKWHDAFEALRLEIIPSFKDAS
ncbi:MAG TPA: hypothetical protein VF669_08890 [Tepidisphaeraceae bacterium]|jgi:hypothetical protein